MNAKVSESRFSSRAVRPFSTGTRAAPSRAVLPRGQRQLVEQSLLRCPHRDGKPRG